MAPGKVLLVSVFNHVRVTNVQVETVIEIHELCYLLLPNRFGLNLTII